MESSLTVLNGLEPGRVMPLPAAGRFVLGRGAGAHGRLNEGGVSREHCAIEIKGDVVRLLDLGSANGTLVNDASVADCVLFSGDRISIGPVSLIFRGGVEKTSFIRLPPTVTADQAQMSEAFAPDTSKAVRLVLDPSRVLEESPSESVSPELARTRHYLNAVCRMAATLPETADATAVIDLAIETIFNVTEAENAAMLLLDGERRVPGIVSYRTRHAAAGQPFVVSNSVVNETLRQGVSIITHNAGEDNRFTGLSINAQRIRSLMCVPIRGANRIIGAFYVDRRLDATKFKEADLSVMSALGFQAGVALERAWLVNDLQSLFVGSMKAIVSSLEARDTYTGGHSERVTRYALVLADWLGWKMEDRDVLEIAALMHDIGKIGIPDHVLTKPSRLDETERLIINTHTTIGAGILGKIPNLERLIPVSRIIDVVRHHHEKVDGTGYPDKLAGEAIPASARILSVVDTYDALTSTRPYRKGMPAEKAIEILRECRGDQLDPAMVDAFLEWVDRGAEHEIAGVQTRFL